MSEGIAVVVGVGPEAGLGAALARRFSIGGFKVYIAGRTQVKLNRVADAVIDSGGQVVACELDATDESQVIQLFRDIEENESSPLQVVACNVDSNQRAPLVETSSEMFIRLWQQNAYAAFLVGREAVKLMQKRQQGTLFFTGASASLRARPPFTAFASAKFALRALAQGLAREFGPQGIHVVHTIIDGVIDGDRARESFPEFAAQKGDDGLLDLDAIAETYWSLHRQPRSVWTHELDLRPFKEPF